MKKTLINLGILLTGSMSAALAQQTDNAVDSTYMNSHYQQRLEFFKKMPDQKNEIVFLGNSITEAGKWQEATGLKHVVNRGISGDVSFGVLARLDEVLASKPAKIFLLIGVNDMKRGIPEELLFRNYQRLIASVKKNSPRTRLYIQSILPINKAMVSNIYSRVSNAGILKFNERLKALCLTEGLQYVNLHAVFAGADGELKKELTTDGLHLRPVAYLVWAEALKKIKAL